MDREPDAACSGRHHRYALPSHGCPRDALFRTRARASTSSSAGSKATPTWTGWRSPRCWSKAASPTQSRSRSGQSAARYSLGSSAATSSLLPSSTACSARLKVVDSLKSRGVRLHLLDLGGDIAGNAYPTCSSRSRRHSPRPSATASVSASPRSRPTRNRAAGSSEGRCSRWESWRCHGSSSPSA